MTRMTIGEAFGVLAGRDPDAVAVRCGDLALTRAELESQSNRLARGWLDDGMRVDDRVVVALPNSIGFVVATVAAWKAGATPVPLSPLLAPVERNRLLSLAGARIVVDANPPIPELSDAPLPALAAGCWKAPTSSGSTGTPKLVLAAASAHVDPDRPVAAFIPQRAVQLVAGPLWHAAPFVYAMRGLMTGHSLELMPSFGADEWLELVQRRRATWGMLVPTMMHRIWRSPLRPATDVSSLTAVLHLGSRCPPWLKRHWLDWLSPERVDEVYAGTESQGIAWINGRDWLDHPGSVGRGTGGSEFTVVRPDGSACAPGETGEILMRRDRATYAYVGEQVQVRDGWHTLGDAGWMDGDGWLHVADRLDDVFVTGGVNVHPADVEQVLEQHPAVRCAVVVGRPHDELGEIVHAVVEGPPVEAELRNLASQMLEPERRPRSYEFTDRPLRGDTAKVRRASLR